MSSFEFLRLGLDFLALTLSLGAVVYAYVRTRHAAQQQELRALGDRLTKAEARLDETPTSKALHEVALSIEHFGGDLKGYAARLDGLGAIVERLETVTNRQEDWIRDTSKGR